MGIHIQEINIIVTHEVTNFIFPLIFSTIFFMMSVKVTKSLFGGL